MKENRAKVLAAKAAKEGNSAPVSAPTPVAAPAPALAPSAPAKPGRRTATTPPFRAASGAPQPSQPAPQLDMFSASGDSAMGKELKRYAYVKWLLRVLTVSILINVAVVAMLFVAGLLAGHRPLVQVTARPSLAAEAEAFFGSETKVSADDLLFFLNTVLPLMHRIDDRGNPELPLLRGMISPKEYERVEKEMVRLSDLAKKNIAIQNLVVTRVEDVEQDSSGSRISAYVRGYLAIIVQTSNRFTVVPYRAQVLLELNPPSRLNRFPFVLLKRDWRMDKAAIDWDAERAAMKAEKPSTPHSK